ncbi:hypothetical protein SAY87_017337 [Trapa incisa]|uniref:Nucleoside phosphorylase domain-containing protein n=1 Tax=Trapa incisa TaxID=236973 RepID=A0AAN7QYD6_9MYRT|nr:hypothetical protein SAY87_017337 [Trapa incisa]
MAAHQFLQPRMPSMVFLVMIMVVGMGACGMAGSLERTIRRINQKGPFLGIVIPNSFQMSPLLNSSSFKPDPQLSNYLDISGKRFRIGRVEDKKVIMVMTGLSMLNAGVTTQLLLTLFRIKGVVHYGIAGNANPGLQIGDVTVPRYWAHTGLWTWQKYGDGAGDDLPTGTKTSRSTTPEQIRGTPEEVVPVNGVPEEVQEAFWVPVDRHYLAVSEKLKELKLERCVNATTCLPRPPVVAIVERGITSNIFVDNKAYREFLYSKFNATAVDMETAAVALICLQQRTPFIAIRSLSDLAGGGSSLSNEASTFGNLAAQNVVDAVIKFVQLLGS